MLLLLSFASWLLFSCSFRSFSRLLYNGSVHAVLYSGDGFFFHLYIFPSTFRQQKWWNRQIMCILALNIVSIPFQQLPLFLAVIITVIILYYGILFVVKTIRCHFSALSRAISVEILFFFSCVIIVECECVLANDKWSTNVFCSFHSFYTLW